MHRGAKRALFCLQPRIRGVSALDARETHQGILRVHQDEGQGKWGGSLSFEVRSGIRQGCALSLTLFNYIINWILGQALQDYPWAQVGANVHESNLTTTS